MTVHQTLHAPPSLHYDMKDISGTIVPDVSGSGFAGVIRGQDRGGAFLEQETVFGHSLPILTLTGGSRGGYLQLPDGCIRQGGGITVSFYIKVKELAGYGALFSFGKDSCFYLSAQPCPDDPDSILLSPGATTGGRSQEAALAEWVPMRKNTWFHAAVTFDTRLPSALSFYVDGSPAAEASHRRMNAEALAGCTDCFFGFGSLSQNSVSMSVTDIRVFSRVLDSKELFSLFRISDPTRLELEMEALCRLFSDRMTELPVLPTAGSLGAGFRFRSLTPDSITGDLRLIRPAAGSPDQTGRLQVTASYRDSRLEKTISFLVPALPSDAERLREDLDAVTLPFPGHVAGDLSLPTGGANGSRFTWRSGDPAHISSAGKVIRPEKEPLSVTLFLEAGLGMAKGERGFTLTLYPVYGQEKPLRIRFPQKGGRPAAGIPLPRAKAVRLREITLLDSSLFGGNQKRCLDYLQLLDCDRMLYHFRRTFGQDTLSARPPGGWEEPSGLLRGHSTGHFLSALAYACASTHEDYWKQKAEYMITELRRLQLLSAGDPAAFATACTPADAAQSLWSRNPAEWGEGYLGAYPPDPFALLEQFTPYATIWAPYYTLHKLLAGLLDCYLQLDSRTALDCAEGIGLWVYRRLSATAPQQRDKMWSMYIAGEYGGMNESLARLYQITGKTEFREAAAMFDNTPVFDGLARGLDTISGLHANQHIPQMIGALQEFITTREPHYYQTARNFWELVTSHYAYSTGGVGRGENFKEPDILAGNIEGSRNCETCAAYNMLKLTGMLSFYDPQDSRLMDYYERTLYNQIAASQNPIVRPDAHHGVTYMLPIGPGAVREYSNDYDDFTCCHGTGMENHVRYTEHIYHAGADGSLYIQLYLSSSLYWEEKGITLTQKTDFPSSFSVFIPDRNARLKLFFRIPFWCREDFCICVNDIPQPFVRTAEATPLYDTFCGADSLTGQSGGYALLEGDFAGGDRITVHMPCRLHLCYTPDPLEGLPAASLMYGPLVMAALHPGTDWITLNLPPVTEDAFVMKKKAGIPVLWYDDLPFVPMYAAHNTPYHTYFKINLL